MRFFRFAPLLSFLLSALPTSAQDDTRFGLGVRINDLFSGGDVVVVSDGGFGRAVRIGTSSVLFPIDAPNLRFEPEVGFGRLGTGEGRSSASVWSASVGLGMFYRKTVSDRTELLLGVRTSFATQGGDGVDGNPVFGGGPHIGADYALGNHFKVGVEAGMLYQRVPDSEASLISTETALYTRFFF